VKSLPAKTTALVTQDSLVDKTAVPVEYMISFVRAMIREFPSSDGFSLAMYAAGREVPITEKQKQAFLRAVTHEVEESAWPKGFFG